MSDKNPIDLLKDLLGGDEAAEQVDELMNTIRPKNHSNSNSIGSSGNSGINPQMIDKMRRMMDIMENSRNDSRAGLLHSLKPYLSEKRQGRIDQCVEFLGMSQIIKMMKEQRKNKEE